MHLNFCVGKFESHKLHTTPNFTSGDPQVSEPQINLDGWQSLCHKSQKLGTARHGKFVNSSFEDERESLWKGKQKKNFFHEIPSMVHSTIQTRECVLCLFLETFINY